MSHSTASERLTSKSSTWSCGCDSEIAAIFPVSQKKLTPKTSLSRGVYRVRVRQRLVYVIHVDIGRREYGQMRVRDRCEKKTEGPLHLPPPTYALKMIIFGLQSCKGSMLQIWQIGTLAGMSLFLLLLACCASFRRREVIIRADICEGLIVGS